MTILVLNELFSVCKLKDYAQVDLTQPFVFSGSTDEECSLVCPTHLVPAGALARSDGWRAFRIAGILDFSLTGILARIASILAEGGIGIFAVSTFDTDYILTRAGDFGKALDLLSEQGYEIRDFPIQ